MNKKILRLNKLFNYIFGEKFYKKLNFNWSKYPGRVEIIQKIIDLKNYKTYLEIGCDDNFVFNQIKLKDKIGVDPYSGGNLRMSSDEFFKDNKKKFDCIFIDGLHYYYQVRKDIINSLNSLNDNGVVLVHDCLPKNYFQQAIPRSQMVWTGDVWRAIVEMRTFKNIDTCVCFADMGIGIIIKRYNKKILQLTNTNFRKLKFRYYYKNYNFLMNIINFNDLQKFLKE